MRNATVVNVPASGVPEPSVRTSVQLPGTCGELFQGTLDGQQCLVSCPIGRFATVEVELQDGPGWETPSASPKASGIPFYTGARCAGELLGLGICGGAARAPVTQYPHDRVTDPLTATLVPRGRR
jgi:hypothetical protein